MNRVILDAELREKLRGANAGLEIADENGKVVGHFLTHEAFLRLAESLLPSPTKEDISEARAEMLAQGGVSGDELLARLDATKRRWEARQ
jgi:hypothetical protein